VRLGNCSCVADDRQGFNVMSCLFNGCGRVFLEIGFQRGDMRVKLASGTMESDRFQALYTAFPVQCGRPCAKHNQKMGNRCSATITLSGLA